MNINKRSFLYLTQENVIKCGGSDMTQMIQDIEQFFILEANGKVNMPSKTVLRWGSYETEQITGRINCMPAYVGGEVKTAGIKWIGSAPLNPSRFNLPRASALIILNDPKNLFPIAVMDGTLISAMRTGAVTGVGVKYLARSDSKIIGLIGAGVQNKTQLLAINEVIQGLEKVYLYDLNKSRAIEWVQQMREKTHLNIQVKDNVKTTIEDADIVVTATTAVEPIITNDDFKVGCLYIQVGGYECATNVVTVFNKFVVDNWREVLHRGIFTLAHLNQEGKFQEKDLHAKLGEIVIGKKEGRKNEQERILFSPIGMGAEDIVVAKRVYQKALEQNIGQELTLWEKPFAV